MYPFEIICPKKLVVFIWNSHFPNLVQILCLKSAYSIYCIY